MVNKKKKNSIGNVDLSSTFVFFRVWVSINSVRIIIHWRQLPPQSRVEIYDHYWRTVFRVGAKLIIIGRRPVLIYLWPCFKNRIMKKKFHRSPGLLILQNISSTYAFHHLSLFWTISFRGERMKKWSRGAVEKM